MCLNYLKKIFRYFDRKPNVKTSVTMTQNHCYFFISRLQTKVKAGLDETLGVAEKSISEAEAWGKPNTLSDELEQATSQIQKSMVNIH